MKTSMTCPHDRVVRLRVPGTSGPLDYWICNICNEQFIQKRQVDWKLQHLTSELVRLIPEKLDEQAARMRAEKGVSVQEGS